jgi:outer membrane biosynthesis protein TonB
MSFSSKYPNLFKSIVLHSGIILLLTTNLKSCSDVEKPQEIAVQIMPMSTTENKPTEEPKPETPKVEEPKEEPKEEPPLPPKIEEKKPPQEVREEPKKAPEIVEKPKPTPDIKEKPKPVEKPDLIEKPKLKEKPKPDKKEEEDKETKNKKESLLKDLDKNKKEVQKSRDGAEPTKQSEGAADTPPDAGLVNEIMAKIQDQVTSKWSIPIGAKDVENMDVVLLITMASDGTVMNVEIVDKSRYNSDALYKVATDSAVRAVKEASPIQGLPTEKHKYWKEVEFTFSPKNAL